MSKFGRDGVASLQFGVPWEDSYGFSQAYQVADTVYISGQLPHDEAGNLLLDCDARAQMRAALANLDRALAAFGLHRRHVVSTTVAVVGLGRNFGPVAAEHQAYFGGHRPSSTALGVAELVLEGQLVEIAAIARTDAAS